VIYLVCIGYFARTNHTNGFARRGCYVKLSITKTMGQFQLFYIYCISLQTLGSLLFLICYFRSNASPDPKYWRCYFHSSLLAEHVIHAFFKLIVWISKWMNKYLDYQRVYWLSVQPAIDDEGHTVYISSSGIIVYI